EPSSPISLSEVEGLTGYMLLQTAQACPVVFRNFGMLFQEPAGDGIKTLHPEESQVSLEYVQIEVAHRRSGLHMLFQSPYPAKAGKSIDQRPLRAGHADQHPLAIEWHDAEVDPAQAGQRSRMPQGMPAHLRKPKRAPRVLGVVGESVEN